ncbi:MAG: RecX family transcriptional regulator [Bacteroidetes bacterium]|nr:RecX family transcriptional regulator [Bacteroidota bacterium]
MKKKQTITEKEALIKAQNMCASQEKCKSEIRKKLFDWKLPQKDHDQIIDQLVKDQFIDEIRYARFFAKDKLTYNKWGKIKIAYTLKQKDIPEDYIQTALDEIEETDYNEILKNELLKKLKSIKDTDEYTIKSKLMRFAASRGFESGKIFDMVSKIIENS